MGGKPPLSDPRWRYVGETPAAQTFLSVMIHGTHPNQPYDAFVDQRWELTDDDDVTHTHVERNVNRRARTAVPPA